MHALSSRWLWALLRLNFASSCCRSIFREPASTPQSSMDLRSARRGIRPVHYRRWRQAPIQIYRARWDCQAADLAGSRVRAWRELPQFWKNLRTVRARGWDQASGEPATPQSQSHSPSSRVHPLLRHVGRGPQHVYISFATRHCRSAVELADLMNNCCNCCCLQEDFLL